MKVERTSHRERERLGAEACLLNLQTICVHPLSRLYRNELGCCKNLQHLLVNVDEIRASQERCASYTPQGKVTPLLHKIETNVAYLQHVRAVVKGKG